MTKIKMYCESCGEFTDFKIDKLKFVKSKRVGATENTENIFLADIVCAFYHIICTLKSDEEGEYEIRKVSVLKIEGHLEKMAVPILSPLEDFKIWYQEKYGKNLFHGKIHSFKDNALGEPHEKNY